jgi:hypothetical protein
LILSPLGEGLSPWFNKLESLPPKDNLSQVWLKLIPSGEEVENVTVYRQMYRSTMDNR